MRLHLLFSASFEVVSCSFVLPTSQQQNAAWCEVDAGSKDGETWLFCSDLGLWCHRVLQTWTADWVTKTLISVVFGHPHVLTSTGMIFFSIPCQTRFNQNTETSNHICTHFQTYTGLTNWTKVISVLARPFSLTQLLRSSNLSSWTHTRTRTRSISLM